MGSIGADLRQMQRTPLGASHVQTLREAGKPATNPAGTCLARPAVIFGRDTVVREPTLDKIARLLASTSTSGDDEAQDVGNGWLCSGHQSRPTPTMGAHLLAPP